FDLFLLNALLLSHIYTLSLRDALPILHATSCSRQLSDDDVLPRWDWPSRYGDFISHPTCGNAWVRSIRSILPGDEGGKYCEPTRDRKSTRLNSSHVKISYAVFCLK